MMISINRDMWEVLNENPEIKRRVLVVAEILNVLTGGFCIVCHAPFYGNDYAADCLDLVCMGCRDIVNKNKDGGL